MGKPIFQRLVTDFGFMRVKGGPENSASAVFDAPENIGARFAMKRTGIGKSRNILANLIGDGFIEFKLNPLSLIWKAGDLVHNGTELGIVHHEVSPRISICPSSLKR